MAKFPYSSGSLEITKYPNAQFLNVTLPDGSTKSCIVLPYSDKWMRLYSDKNQNVHAELSINIDDATGLNNWAREQAQQQGRQHTDFHGQIHLTPGKEARKAWQKKLEEKYDGMMPDEMEAELQKIRLDKASIAQSDYYRQHPDRVPTREQLVARLASNEMQRLTAAGRIYSTELSDNVPVATTSATATVATIPTAEPIQPAQPSEQTQHFANMLGGGTQQEVQFPPQVDSDGLPF